MKDHQIREFVNSLTYIATKYYGTEQLRERIANELRDFCAQAETSFSARAERMAEAEFNRGYGCANQARKELSQELEKTLDKCDKYESTLKLLSAYVACNGDTWVQERALEALEEFNG